MYKYKFSQNPIQFLKYFYHQEGISGLFYQGKKFLHQREIYKTYYSSNKKPTIEFDGEQIPYFYHNYNTTWVNERIIEIPLITHIIKKSNLDPSKILELGHVMRHYFPDLQHHIVDKYEIDDGVLNEDIIEFKPQKKYKMLFSISTLEHVGWDDHPQDDKKIPLALDNIKRNIITQDGVAYFTFPFGYNDNLDKIVNEGESFSSINVFKKINKYNEWEETELNEIQDYTYDKPYFNANALILAELRNE